MIAKSPAIWVTISLICFTFMLAVQSSPSDTETSHNVAGSSQNKNTNSPLSSVFDVELRKCRNSQINDNFLIIPSSLRVPHDDQILGELTASFGNKLYNFTLKDFNGEFETENEKIDEIFNLNVENNYTKHISAKNLNMTTRLYAQTLHYFTPFGFLKTNRTFHHPKNYCIFNVTLETISAGIIERSHVTPPLPKCCPVGMVVTHDLSNPFDRTRCSFISTPEFVPYAYDNTQQGNSREAYLNFPPNFEYKPLSCTHRVTTIPWTEARANQNLRATLKQIKILKNGHVATRTSGNHDWEEPHGGFCLDGFFDTHESTKFEGQERELVIQRCQDMLQDQVPSIISLLYTISYSISFIFFLLIIIIYGLIWAKQNIHGWTIVTFSFCGMANSFCVILGHSFGLTKFQIYSIHCITLGIVGHYFYISFFSWLTLLNYDLWVTIRSMKPKSERSKGKRRFLVYCLLGFGLPTLSVSISNLIEHNFGFFDDRVIRPQYGRTRCFIDKSAALVHATAPNTILFLFNILLAILILKTLWEFKKGTKFLQTAQSTKRNQSNFVLFGKLSMLMGFSWVFEVLSNLIGNSGEKLIFLWLIFDLYNAIQVIYLFWIFVSKKDVRVHLATKYKIFNAGFSMMERTTSTWQSRKTTMMRTMRMTRKPMPTSDNIRDSREHVTAVTVTRDSTDI